MKVTIKTVAEKAGVSVPTVSRVLNSPELVKPATRDRVLEVVQSLDYHPNDRARGLRSLKSRIIGVLAWQIKDFFFGELFSGINKAAIEQDMHVLLFDALNDPKRAMEGLIFLKRQQSDAIIFTSEPILEDYYAVIASLHLPVVLALTEGAKYNLSSFKVDDVKAVFDAVGYLVARGHRSIGMISGPTEDTIAGNSRLSGFRKAMGHYQLPLCDEQIAFGRYRYEHGYAAMSQLLQNRETTGITAVFAASDEMAVGAMRCLHDNGLRVPDDISLMGYDNVALSDMVTPKLTTIAQPFEQIGMESVRYLYKVLETNGDFYSGNHFLPHRIIERDSVKSLSYDSS